MDCTEQHNPPVRIAMGSRLPKAEQPPGRRVACSGSNCFATLSGAVIFRGGKACGQTNGSLAWMASLRGYLLLAGWQRKMCMLGRSRQLRAVEALSGYNSRSKEKGCRTPLRPNHLGDSALDVGQISCCPDMSRHSASLRAGMGRYISR